MSMDPNHPFTVVQIQATPLGEESEVVKLDRDQLLTRLSEQPDVTTEISTTPVQLMETIVDQINLTPELIADCSICWEDGQHVYQLFSVDPEKSELPEPLPLNQIGSLLVGREKGIYGPALLFKAEIQEDHHCANVSATLADVQQLLTWRLQHTGIHLKTDGTWSEFSYTQFPLAHLSEEERADYSSQDLSIFDLNLILYFRFHPEPAQVNKKATRLYGERKVYGDVYLVNRVSDYNYGELTDSMMEDLVKTSLGPLKARKLQGDELTHGQSNDRGKIVINGYRILALRAAQHQSKCHYCETEGKVTVCGGCYRLCYRDSQCQKSDWRTHQEDCIRTSKSLNQHAWEKFQQAQEAEGVVEEERSDLGLSSVHPTLT